MERLLNAKVEPGRVAIHWLGHGGFAMKAHAGDLIVVDPYLTDSANADGSRARQLPPPVRPRDVKADYLFLTHDHIDHADPDTIAQIVQANPDVQIVCPPSCCSILTRLGITPGKIEALTAGQQQEFPNFVVHAVKAYHTEDSLGFLFEFDDEGTNSNGVNVYLTGVTSYDRGLGTAVADYGPDVLILPIDGDEGSMDAEAAAKLAAEIAPTEVIPTHYGLFDDENVDTDEFVSLLKTAIHDEDVVKPVIMKYNTCHVFHPADETHGRHAHKKMRAERARSARRGHQHNDGLRGPNGGSGIARGGGRAV